MNGDDNDRTPAYPGGMKAVLSRMEERRAPFSHAPGEALPHADLDLAPLLSRRVTDPALDPAERAPFRSSYHRKRFGLRQEFTGAPEICFLNALLVAHLRKRAFPAQTPALFQRLWAEQGAFLIAHLDPRWLVSSVTTFGDHGLTATQRGVGLALTVLFGSMKLYESERLFSGVPPDRTFPLESRIKARLPLDMDAYALSSGGLDVNLLGRLWQEAAPDPVIAPLAHHLLDLLVHDDRALFSRLMAMRRRAEDLRKPAAAVNVAPVPCSGAQTDPLRWGLVSTVKAPLRQIARFAAHHIDLGATAVHLYLDDPGSAAAAFLSSHPRIHLTRCDDAYWRDTGKPRMEAHQLRQAFNATRTLRDFADSLDWLAHVDVDEMLLAQEDVAVALSQIAPEAAVARIVPAEVLASDTAADRPAHFKLSHKGANVARASLQEVYPTFGMHLPGGFLSHTAGKAFARTGIPDTRFGIHTLKYKGADATNRVSLRGVHLGHLHASSWEDFRSRLDFRRALGSYRPRSEPGPLGLSDILTYLDETEGPKGLRALFDEVAQDSPELRARLAARGMLLVHPLDLDAAVLRVFGALP